MSLADAVRAAWSNPERRAEWIRSLKGSWTPERLEAHKRRLWQMHGPGDIAFEDREKYRRLRADGLDHDAARRQIAKGDAS